MEARTTRSSPDSLPCRPLPLEPAAESLDSIIAALEDFFRSGSGEQPQLQEGHQWGIT